MTASEIEQEVRDGESNQMIRSRSWFLVFTGLVILGTTLWGLNRQFRENINLQPDPRASIRLARDAKPVLLQSRPLPAAGRELVAKPVVAFTGTRGVVIAQDVAGSHSRLTTWQATSAKNHPIGNEWMVADTFPNWPASAQFIGDPWVVADAWGRFHCVQTSHGEGVLAHRRTAGDDSRWENPRQIATGADRPMLGASPDGKRLVMAVSRGELSSDWAKANHTGSPTQIRQQLTAAIRWSTGIFVSSNGGRDWEQLNGPLASQHAIPFSVVIDNEGRIAGSWISTAATAMSGIPVQSRSVVCISSDRGMSWVESELVDNLQPDRDHPFNGERYPVVAIDGRGTLHVAYINAGARSVVVKHSQDWLHWSQPKLLSSGLSAVEFRMPAIAADGSLVHVTWAERSQDHWQMIYCGSIDHGEMWSDQIRLSIPQADTESVDAHGFQLTSDDDQSCIAIDGQRRAHVVWAVRGATPPLYGRIWHAVIQWQPPLKSKTAGPSTDSSN